MKGLPEEELRFGEMVVSQGICTRERLDECLDLLRRLRETGVAPLPRLGELLVRKGYLSVGDSVRLGVEPSLPAEAVQAAADPKNHVGKYVRVASLGAGAMGEVWRAWDRDLRRWVALKFLREPARGELERFRREAQTVAKLNHPNIAAVYETGEAQGRPYIVMQYVVGRTLSALSSKDRRLASRIVRDAATAVQYAHEQGIVHRDLKPQNIMVEMKPFRVYVMDFGLAKRMAVDASVSAAGSIAGTPNYMSPEQARGRTEEVGPRSDVYSLGATLYEMLTNRQPFAHGDILEILRKVAEEDPVPVRLIDPGVDRDLETIVMKCLEKSPSRRYPSASALAKDLTRWLDGDAIAAHPPSIAYRVVKKLSKRKTFVIATCVVVLAIAAGAAYWMRLRQEARGWVRLARSKAAEGNVEEAKRLLDQARARAVVDEDLYRSCVERLEEPRRLAEAKAEKDQAFRSVWGELATLPMTVEGRRRGIALLDEVLRRYPDVGEAWMWRAECHQRLSEFEEALEDYRKAYTAQPKLAAAHYQRGRLLHFTGRGEEEVVREWTAAVEADPGNEYALFAKAYGALLRRDFREAFAACTEAERIATNLAELCTLRGYIRIDPMGGYYDPDEAIRQFSTAIEHSFNPAIPHFMRAYAHRAKARGLSGTEAARERRLAIEDCDAALKVNPNFQEARRLRDLLNDEQE